MINDELTHKIIGCCYQTFNILGPGFIEKDYAKLLESFLIESGLRVNREFSFAIPLKAGVTIKKRLDFIIDDTIILELKVFDKITKFHILQVVSYLKYLNKHIGLIVAFNSNGVSLKRVINTDN